MDFSNLFATADHTATGSVDVDQIKRDLPIAFVLEKAGFAIEEYDGTAAHLRCPFHADSDPSFDIYGEDLERWGCFPCGLNGDVLDLIGRLFALSQFKDKVGAARQLIEEKKAAAWQGPTTGIKRTFDFEAARALVAEARAVPAATVEEVVGEFLDAKSYTSAGLADVTVEWLVQTFRLGARGSEVVIPYYNRDGDLVSYKHRTAETKALSPSGAGQFDDVLYGEWRDREDAPVVLCEGETDVWAATAALPDTFVCMGLPTGAGSHPKQASRLAGRRVVVALDGDKAGRDSTRKWFNALREQGCHVLLSPVPDDTDLAGMPAEGIRGLVARARAVPSIPDGILRTPEGYKRPGKEVHTPLSNWTFEPTRELVGKDGMAYEGIVHPWGTEAVLSSRDLSTKTRIVNWALEQGGSWYGGDRDAQLVLANLQAEGPFLAPGRLANIAGLHEGQFIWPGGKIGADYWAYVSPSSDVHLEDRIQIERRPDDWAVQQIEVLRELHQHRVTDPFLAWLALAPLRSMLREFPILAVTGGSGSGKTTLVETMVRNFSGTLIANNLTATTKHSVFAFIGSTNAFPVWFDEYRPGARKDTMETLNQLLRDAYTGQASSKGGMGDNWAEVTSVPMGAPLIVSGEDAFSETSHTERMVLLALPVEGKSREHLERVKGWGDHGFAYAYLEWLHDGFEQGYLPVIRNFEAGPEDLPTRQRLNIGALELGWALLSQFCFSHGGYELGEPDWSLIVDEGREAASHNPIKDCILWAMDQDADGDMVFVDHQEGLVHVRAENLVAQANRFGFPLPGGPKAIRAYLKSHYDADEATFTIYGKKRRSVAFELEHLAH